MSEELGELIESGTSLTDQPSRIVFGLIGAFCGVATTMLRSATVDSPRRRRLSASVSPA
jgi:hypothetical protein